MKEQIIWPKWVSKCAPALVTASFVVCAGCLSGCADSFDGEPGTSLAGKQANERNPTAALAAGPAKAPAINAGQLARVADTFTSMNTPGNRAYKIGPLDILEISVFKVPDLSKSVQVADGGTINLPLVGEVAAAGKTPQELERDLTARFGARYLQNPQVTVYVREYNSQRVTIEGAIRTPGVYPIKGRASLLQLIATAGSLDKDTASSEVVVFRTIDGKHSAARFDIDEIRSGNAEDPYIMQGDVIIVDTSTRKVVINNVFRFLPLATFVPLL